MNQSRKRGRRGQRGQSIVETAIVMPLFVFLVLGIIQLSLMHQARSVAKYGAFRAARAGSMQNADPVAMEQAAWDVLQPLVRPNNAGRLHAEVVICAPTREVARQAQGNQRGNNPHLAFDEPRAPNEEFEARKLAIQLTFYYPMFIPFADRVIFLISQAQEAASAVLFREVVRMGTAPTGATPPTVNLSRRLAVTAATGNPFVVPIRANYALRLQSDVPLDGRLPEGNPCVRL